MISLQKSNEQSSAWAPLEKGRIEVAMPGASRVMVCDAALRPYVEQAIPRGAARFTVRGRAGVHTVSVLDGDGTELARTQFTVRPRTRIACSKGPYAALADRVVNQMIVASRRRPYVVDGKLYNFFVSWGRDHTHVMKAMKYFERDVTSGIEFFLERQQPSGMFWDDCHPNISRPHPNWFCEALGDGYWTYSDDMAYTIRRIPVEADVEFLYTECVWYAWKATGDDAWMAEQLPRLEKALKYNGSHPTRWSRKHKLVRRSFCADSWDFVNPHFCNGDHRCINPGDPQFLFHSDNSGFYASHWRMAEMYEALGNRKRASELRQAAEALRKRANDKLFFKTHYGHMIPEKLPEKDVYDLVGDERERMSLSTGYTINRGLPTHKMAVRILKEYQRRGKARRDESFAEWWSMDPMYTYAQWPASCGEHPGHYMNGAVGVVVAGELARAAFEHGLEDYGADILRRVWKVSERDGGHVHSAYKRLPEDPPPPQARFRFADLRPFANVGLRHGAHEGVTAWTDEGDNDMRNLPVGKQAFGAVEFDVIDPARNGGRAVVRLDADPAVGAPCITVPVDAVQCRTIYFMHTLAHSAPRGAVVGTYDVCYADGSEERIYVRNAHEIGTWWGIADNPDLRRHRDPVDRAITRVAWCGANGEWKNVGLHMTGWSNPHPGRAITAIRMAAVGQRGGGIMLGAVSFSDGPVQFETDIRSGGWPDNWSHASVYYAIAEGLAGIQDAGRAFDRVRVCPRWAATESDRNEATLHYPASDGYCSYDYRLDRKRKRMKLDLTGSFEAADVHCLLPEGTAATRVVVEKEAVPFKNTSLEGAHYVDFCIDGLPAGPVSIEYE